MLPAIEITDEDISLVAKELNLQFDDERKLVLKEIKSCDVQAGPGSGKTTLLTAKLAILARKWPYRDRGICVLSHTKVARQEIENKLSQSAELRRLLSYPHFIGTIQTFVDQFLAIPFLRREKVEIMAIDNDRFGERAWSVFRKNYSSLSYGLLVNRYRNNEERAKALLASLRLDGAQMGVVHSGQKIKGFPRQTTPTGQALIAVKQLLRTEGYFRYDDMYAFAQACLLKIPYVANALRQRFPWIFIDELQDTDVIQDRIVEQIFGTDDCVFQRFGDKNQAIFDFETDDDDTPSLFGRRNTLRLNRTRRFGQSIASLTSRFTAVEPQVLQGNDQQPQCENTIFVFDHSTAKQVVPLFADLVLKSVPLKEREKHPVKVVASRANTASHKRDNFPVFLGDYLEAFVSPKTAKPARPDTLIGYVLEARQKWAETGNGVEPYNQVVSGILALLRRSKIEPPPQSKTSLHQNLLQKGRLAAFQHLLWSWLNPTTLLDEQNWANSKKEILDCFEGLELTKEMTNFLVWDQCAGLSLRSGKRTDCENENIYLHKSDENTLRIHFDTIHGVKGQTHAATLYVETFHGTKHDLDDLLPVLNGSMHGSVLQGASRKNCKKAFVAMTRPSYLLCLAISSEHINDQQANRLAATGWKVVKL